MDETVKLWSVKSQKQIYTLKGHINSIFSITFSSDGKYLAAGGADKTVKLWNVE
jgi:WD40 repeat protein